MRQAKERAPRWAVHERRTKNEERRTKNQEPRTNTRMKTISIVVPVYFNAETLPDLLRRFQAVAEGLSHYAWEVVFVDDGSGDDSFGVLKKLVAGEPRIRALRLSRNFGSNAAILAGLNCAKGDAVVVISADLQDPPEAIPALVAKWEEGNQVVMAARQSRQDPFLTRLMANWTNRMIRRYIFPEFPPNGFDFMLIDRRVRDELVRMNERNSFIFGQTLWVGFKRAVIPYNRAERTDGESRWTLTKKIKYLIDIFTAFSYLPVRVASALGALLALSGFLYAVFIVCFWLFGSVPIAGWASLIVIVLIAAGTQLLILGVLGEYLWRALDGSRNRPVFVVAESYGADDASALSQEVAS